MRKSLRILFIFEKLQVNGASISILHLMEALVPLYEVELFLFSHEGNLTDRIPSGVKLLPKNEWYAMHSTPMKRGILSAFRARRWDLAWFRFRIAVERAFGWPFRQWNRLPLITGRWDVAICYSDGFLAQVTVSRVACGKRLLWVHENYEDSRYPSRFKRAFAEADGVVCASRDAILHWRNWYGGVYNKPMVTVHNIVKADSRSRQLKFDGKSLIVSIGRISPEKGFDLIPLIANELEAENIDFEWVIVGGGLTPPSGSDRVHFIGQKDCPQDYLRRAAVFVSTSSAEGWGMTISEALLTGVPVVVSDLAVFREQVEDGVNGFCVPRTPRAFAEAIARILTDDELAARMSVAARGYPFTEQSVIEEFGQALKLAGVGLEVQ